MGKKTSERGSGGWVVTSLEQPSSSILTQRPQFAILSRDGLRLQLGRSASDPRSAQRAPCTLWLDVAAIGGLYAALQEKVRIEWGPEVYFYHRREFAFRDPDGHWVILSEVTDDPSTCEVE